MAAKTTDASSPEVLKMHKELLDAYEHASRNWLARVQSEVNLWSELASKLSGSHSLPDALEAYQKFVAQRMQMAAEDGRQLFEECQKITQKITRSMAGSWPTGGSAWPSGGSS
jgi:Phasin protein